MPPRSGERNVEVFATAHRAVGVDDCCTGDGPAGDDNCSELQLFILSDSDASKIIQGRPYTDKSQLVSKKVVSEPTYEKIKDHVVARQVKS